MAVTRIKNNQITDSTIIANAKIQNYTVTSSLLANNLTYGSDFTVTGNLTVNGTTTTIDTVNTLIEDPLITLADGQTSGSPTVDIGTIGLRGTELSAVLAWKESATSFVAALSNTTVSNTTFNLNQYADFKANSITANADLTVTGTTSLIGNITGPLNVTGDINGSNVYSTGYVSASGDVAGGNLATGGYVTATGNITGGNIDTGGQITATGNISSQGRISATGNVHAGNVNSDGQVSAAGNITAGSGAYFLGDGSLLTGVAAASVNAGNLVGNTLSANVTFSSLTSVGDLTSLSVVGTTQTGNLQTAGLISATGTITGGNVATGGEISGTGNITGGNLFTGGAVSATSTVTGGNLATGGTVSATGTITGGNVDTGGTVSATGTITGGNVDTSGTVSATGNVTGGNVLTSGSVSAQGNVLGGNVITDYILSTNTANTTLTINAATISLNPVGNVGLNSRWINNLANPENPQDAATKQYVDDVAQGLNVHDSTYAATGNTLANITGGSTTYYNGPTNNGAGATITTTGSYTDIDGVAINVANTRILVRAEANAVWNGVYVYSNTTVITRAADYNTVPEVEAGDFIFNLYGNVYGNTGWVQTSIVSNVGQAGNNISFTQFSGAGAYTAGNAITIDGTVINVNIDTSGANTIGINGSNELYIPASATLTTPNIGAATGTSVSVTGDVTGGNLATAGTVSATGTGTFGNVDTGGTVSATGNITGGNIMTTGASGNITGANVIASTSMTATGTITGGNVATGGTVSATGNITGGNVATGGEISGTGNITGGNILTGGLISATGNVTAANFFGNISGNVDAGGSNTQIQFNNDNIIDGSSGFTFNYTSNLVTMSGNLDVGNIFSPGSIQANGNVYGDNFIALTNLEGGNLSVAGNVLGSYVSMTGNVDGANFNAVGGNLAIGNISAAGTVVGANVVGGNLYMTGDELSGTNGIVSVNSSLNDVDFAVSGDTDANIFYVDAGTGTVSFGSSTQTACAIVAMNTTTSFLMPVGNNAQRPSSTTTGMLRFNTTNNSVEVFNNSEWQNVGATEFTLIQDEQFNGDGSTVAFTLNGTYTTQSCIVAINGVVQIPTSAYSVSGVDPTCVLTFTEAPEPGDVIDVRELATTSTITGLSNGSGNAAVTVSDGSNVVAVTGSMSVTGDLTVDGNAIITGNVATNQINNGTSAVQIPTVNGNVNIDVAGIDNMATFAPGNLIMAGNIIPTANITYDLGTTTTRWKDLWLSNSTIYMGNAQISANATSLIFTNPQGGQTVLAGTTSAITGASVSVTGNITGNYILGNGSQLTGIDATSIQNGTSSVSVIASGGNVRANVGGATVTTTYASGLAVTGLVSATGTVTGASVVGGVMTGTSVSVSGGVTAASVAGGVITGTSTSVTGTTTAASVVGGVITGSSASATGNVTGGNINTAGIVSATGNITGGNITPIGNVVLGDTQSISIGSLVITDDTIRSTQHNITIGSLGNIGNVIIGGNLTVNGNTTTINSNTVTTNDLTYNFANNASSGAQADGGGIEVGPVGSPYITWLYSNSGNLWVSNAGISAVGNITGANIRTGGSLSATGAVVAASTVGGVITGSSASVTGAVTAASTVGGVITGSSASVTGAVTAASVVGGVMSGTSLTVTTGSVTAGSIINGNANGVGNIGSSTTYFNTVFAKATSAQYADLAEKYTADAEYAPGTVVVFGGTHEVTVNAVEGDRKVAGVISTNPSYIMNGTLEAEHVATVALTGRVPTLVVGPVKKGDLMVAAGLGRARAEADPKVGTVIGKALEDFNGAEGTIEVVVGRF